MANSRQKGADFEREVVNELKEKGLDAKKVPLSGAVSDFEGDIWISPSKDSKYWQNFPVPKLVVEAKRRKRGFKTIYDAIEQGGGNDIVVARDDRKEAFFVLPKKTMYYFLEEAGWLQKKEG